VAASQFATEGKDQETWAKFVEALEKHNGHRLPLMQVSLDMSLAYQRGVADHCLDAQVMFDKFRVIKNANEAVDKVRRAEVRLGGQGVWEALHKSQWLWRKNPEHLTEPEQVRFAGIKKQAARHGHGISNADGVTGHLPQPGCDDRPATLPSLVPVSALGGSILQGQSSGGHGEVGANDRASSGRHPGILEMGRDQCV
jgi:hypothetical protein